MESPSLILVGAIATSHGVRGQVKVRSFTSVPEDIANYSPLTDKAGTRIFGLRIVGHTKDSLIATIEGITNKELADALRGTELYAPSSALPPLKKNEFYVRDLIGMTVINEDGSLFGITKHLHNFGGGDLLEIQMEGSSNTEMLPFTTAIFPVINMEKRTMVIHPPEYITVEDPSHDI